MFCCLTAACRPGWARALQRRLVLFKWIANQYSRSIYRQIGGMRRANSKEQIILLYINWWNYECILSLLIIILTGTFSSSLRIIWWIQSVLFSLFYFLWLTSQPTIYNSIRFFIHRWRRQVDLRSGSPAANVIDRLEAGFFKGFVGFPVCICWQVCPGLIRRWTNDILYIKLTVPHYRLWTKQRIN